MLDLKEVDNDIDGKINKSIGIGESKGKQDTVIIVCASCVLCLQLFFCK